MKPNTGPPSPIETRDVWRKFETDAMRRHRSEKHFLLLSLSSLTVVLQSMDRANTDRSPVFYLEPIDWIRTEGSSPLPYKEKMPTKVLGGLAGNSLDILTESEENLNTEIEMINTKPCGRGLETLRNISEPCFRHATPTIELTPDPDQGYSSTASTRSRSLTPGLSRLELTGKERKVRRTTFPILCSRPGSACDKMVNRKKSFVSSEDLRRAGAGPHFSSSNLQTLQGKMSAWQHDYNVLGCVRNYQICVT